MNKLKKLISIGLGAIMSLGLVACNDSSNDGSDNGPQIPETITYANFEQWGPDFQLIRVQDYAGVINVNTDKTYAKDEQSLLINPIGAYSSSATGKFIFPLASELFDFNYSNFTTVEKITVEFYNASENDVKIAFGLTPTIKSIDAHTYTPYEWYTLKANEWTTLEYEVDTQALSFLYDVTKIAGFYMMFENMRTSRDETNAPDIYCDNIVIHNTTVIPPKDETFRVGEMEYLDFEDPLQINALEFSGTISRLPAVDIVKASDMTVNGLSLQATSGENVLRIEWQMAKEDPVSGFEQVKFVELVAENSILSKLSEAELDNIVFCMDVYNACSKEMYMEFDFGQNLDCIFGGWDLKPNQWTTIRYSMADVYAKYSNWEDNGWIRFVMSSYNATKYNGNKLFYVDNMHFEWASEVTTK